MSSWIGPVDINVIDDVILLDVLLSSDSESTSDDDDSIIFWQLHMIHHVDRLPVPVVFQGPRVADPWNFFEPDSFKSMCRFRPDDFHEMIGALNFPLDSHPNWTGGCVKSIHGCVAGKAFAVFLVLRRLCAPERWSVMCRELRCTRQWAKQIFSETVGRLHTRYERLITRIDLFRIAPMLGIFASAVAAKGALIPDCVCFIDGKYTRTCVPKSGPRGSATDYQWLFYNGHYGHGLKSQHILFADGIHVTFTTTVKDGDSVLLNKSRLHEMLDVLFVENNMARPAVCYGDSAYGETLHLRRSRRGMGLPQHLVDIDESMRAPRMTVEQSFSKVTQLFAFVDYSKKLQLWRTPIAQLWAICDFFANVHTCFYQSQVCSFFDLEPPTIADYLRNAHLNAIV